MRVLALDVGEKRIGVALGDQTLVAWTDPVAGTVRSAVVTP